MPVCQENKHDYVILCLYVADILEAYMLICMESHN